MLLLDDAKKLVSATQNGSSLNVKFDTVLDDSKFFTFTIDSIQRKDEDVLYLFYDNLGVHSSLLQCMLLCFVLGRHSSMVSPSLSPS